MEWEADSDSENIPEDKQLKFVNLLVKYPIVLEKSQIPSVKSAKKEAAMRLLKELHCNKILKDEQKLYKKINNMKTQIKKKTDVGATGNRKIKLCEWERIFFSLMKPETNPVFSKVPGAVGAGLPSTTTDVEDSDQRIQMSTAIFKRGAELPPPPEHAKLMKKASDILAKAETEETRLMSTSQLQRLVLLEQLKLIKMKQQQQKSKFILLENPQSDLFENNID